MAYLPPASRTPGLVPPGRIARPGRRRIPEGPLGSRGLRSTAAAQKTLRELAWLGSLLFHWVSAALRPRGAFLSPLKRRSFPLLVVRNLLCRGVRDRAKDHRNDLARVIRGMESKLRSDVGKRIGDRRAQTSASISSKTSARTRLRTTSSWMLNFLGRHLDSSVVPSRCVSWPLPSLMHKVCQPGRVEFFLCTFKYLCHFLLQARRLLAPCDC